MCGISGIFDRSGKTPKDSSIKLMNSFMDKRGPDHEAVYTSEYIGLGHRRLSIIDLSQNAMQPMASEEYGTMILFNGEIYNHMNLRNELKLPGYSISNLSLVRDIKDIGYIKLGVKKIFDYSDVNKTDGLEDFLSTYEPGQRFFISLNFNFSR